MTIRKKVISMVMVFGVMIAMTPALAFSSTAYAAVINVASTGGTEYSTLQDAINAVSSSGTVKLIANANENVVIPSGKTIIIDLNGNNITGSTAGNEEEYPAIKNSGNLTVNGSGNVTSTQIGESAIYNTSGGTVTLNGGTYSDEHFYVICNEGTMTINKGVSASVTNHATSTILNGYSSHIYASDPSNGKIANMTINGGTFTGSYNTVKNGDWSGNLTINGGTFNIIKETATLEKASSYDVIKNYGACTVKVTGGSFINSVVTNDIDHILAKNESSSSDYVVTGGTFNADPGKYLSSAAGQVVKNKNGNYVVEYIVSALASPKKGGKVTGVKTVESGSNVTLKATANNFYYFVKWTKSGKTIGTKRILKVKNVTTNEAYVAVFKKYSLNFTLSKKNSTKIKVHWKSVKGARGYQIANNATKSGKMKVQFTGKSSNNIYTSINKVKGKTYKYKMRYYTVKNSKKVWSNWTSEKSIKR